MEANKNSVELEKKVRQIQELAPAKKGISRETADSHIHYTAISEVSVYKENDGSPLRIPEHPGRDGQKPPFVDKKLQDFFDSVKKKTNEKVEEDSAQGRPEMGGPAG